MSTENPKSDTPSLERLPTPDVSAETGTEKPRESAEKTSLADIERLYDDVDALGEHAVSADVQAREIHTQIQDIRIGLELPALERPMATATDASLEQVKQDMQEQLHNLERKEREFLGAPEGEGSPSENEAAGRFEDDRDEREESEKQEERKEMKEDRQKAVERWMKGEIEKSQEHFKNKFDGAENGEKAFDLLAVKMGKKIMRSAEDYIKTGENADVLAYATSLELTTVKKPDGGKEVFVTDVLVETGKAALEKLKPSLERGEKLVADKEEKKLDDAEDKGQATTEKAK